MLCVHQNPANFNRNPGQRGFHHVSKVEHSLQFWQRGLNVSHIFLKVNYLISKPYDLCFRLNTKVTVIVLTLSFEKSMIDTVISTEASKRLTLKQLRQEIGALMTHLLGRLFPSRKLNFGFFMGTGSIAEEFLLA